MDFLLLEEEDHIDQNGVEAPDHDRDIEDVALLGPVIGEVSEIGANLGILDKGRDEESKQIESQEDQNCDVVATLEGWTVRLGRARLFTSVDLCDRHHVLGHHSEVLKTKVEV